MAIISAKELLTSGAHFGHSSSRWNPKMKPYILGKRNKIHIINLRETVKGVVAAFYLARKTVAEGQQVLFVGTKRQAREIMVHHGKRCEMPFVAERWLGGTLTNLQTIILRVRRLIELEGMVADGSITTQNKKMQSAMNRELRKIKRNLDGIRNLDRLPGLIFVVDPIHDHTAVSEAKRLGIPVMAMLDTDADPDSIDLPIPANDDAIRAIDLIVGKVANACIEGAQYRRDHPELAKQASDQRAKHREREFQVGAVSVGGRR